MQKKFTKTFFAFQTNASELVALNCLCYEENSSHRVNDVNQCVKKES